MFFCLVSTTNADVEQRDVSEVSESPRLAFLYRYAVRKSMSARNKAIKNRFIRSRLQFYFWTSSTSFSGSKMQSVEEIRNMCSRQFKKRADRNKDVVNFQATSFFKIVFRKDYFFPPNLFS